MAYNDNWDHSNPEHLRAYIRECVLDLERKEKASSPLAGLRDRGIDLTPEEDREVRAYAERLGVDFGYVARNVAAGYTIIEDRHNTKMWVSLASRRVIPRNTLARTLKGLIYLEAGRIERRKATQF